ncbi:MAG TPA: energy transducer TonB [Candidatus Didemnitutus sp.]|nr:energy transducer TonB [Candidatus Didemnitutus sp.]
MIASYRHPHRSGEMRRDAYSGYGLALLSMAVLLATYTLTRETYPIVKGIQEYTSITIDPPTSFKIINDLFGGEGSAAKKLSGRSSSSGGVFMAVDNVTEPDKSIFTIDVPPADGPVGDVDGPLTNGGDNGGGPLGDPNGTDVTVTKEPPADGDFIVVTKEPSYDESALRSATIYPEVARRNGIEGTVVVKALIGADGSVLTAVVLESDNQILEAAALEAIRSIRFTAADNNGQKVACHVFVPFVFRLGR